MTYGNGYYEPGTPGPRVLSVVVTCSHCDESTDCDVNEELGATDIVPDVCPSCEEPWPFDALENAEVEVGF